MTGDAVDHGVSGRETRRNLVVAGLAQHDPGDRRPVLAHSERVITKHEICRHHLRHAGDRSRMLVRPDVNPRLSDLDGGLTVFRPHGAGDRYAARSTVLGRSEVAGWCGRRRRGRQQLVGDVSGDRNDDDQHARDAVPANPNRMGCCSRLLAVGHASTFARVVL